MKTITLHDKQFSSYIDEEQIIKSIAQIAAAISEDYKDCKQPPILVPILNGTFMFAADLGKMITIPVEFHFVSISSYNGLQSKELKINLDIPSHKVKQRDILIVEDILDTGKTLASFKKTLNTKNVQSVRLACLFRKPNAVNHCVEPDYVGIDIPNDFVVGYGMDYDGLGRNLKNLYKIV